MRRVPLAVVFLFSLSAAASSAMVKFIGEGGGYKGSDTATDDYLVGNQTQTPPPPANVAPAAAAAPVPAPAPVAVSGNPAPSAPASPAPVASKGAVAFPSSSQAASPKIQAPNRSAAAPVARPAGRQSLWNGLVQPLEMGAPQVGASDDDGARAQSDRDYETHILGLSAGSARAPLGAQPPAGRATPTIPMTAATARAAGGKVFVSLALDPREAGSLRDAVAGLGAAAGFSADARFEARPGPNGTVLYSGWIPAGRLGDAMARPGVKSLRVETRSQPSSPSETSGEFLVGLRLEDPSRAREAVDAGVRALGSAADFRLTRVVGLETAPDGRSVAVVAGVLPLSRLSRAMGLSEVAEILPVGGEVPPPPSPAAAEGGKALGFVKFAVQRGPLLILLTLLLLLPSLRGPVRRAVSIFSPYHR